MSTAKPLIQYEDHSENFTMHEIQVKESNLGNHFEASIEIPNGPTFTARHADKRQAIHDVEVAVREAHKRGQINPGIF